MGVVVTAHDKPEPGKGFYILDVRSAVGNCALFWRPDGMGYTTQLGEAGLYTEADAKSHRETDVAIPEAIAHACSVTHVRVERLRQSLDQAGIPWPEQKTFTRVGDNCPTGAYKISPVDLSGGP